MKRIDAYLFFDNNCREVMTFYQECLGGELNLMTIAQSPIAAQMPEHMADLIMHACLNNGDVILMASDNCMGQPIPRGKNVTLSLNCSSEEEVHALYAKLSAGGQANNPPKLEFWGDVFGMLTDKYDQDWMVTYSLKSNSEKL